MNSSADTPPTVLLVEDNPIDVRAINRAFAALDRSCVLEVVVDGDAAISRLCDPGAPRPDLVLLDLNLPGSDGNDVLERVMADASLRRLPIIVLTTSANDFDVSGAYDRGANAYVNKPSDLAGWRALVSAIDGFWLEHVRLPA